MAIRGDSYSSVADVVAYTRHLIGPETTFNSTTRPTLTEVEDFIDEASANLNLGFLNQGFLPANVKANSTAKLSCDHWVRTQASSFVEITHPFQGLNSDQNRSQLLQGLMVSALDFAKSASLPLMNLGVEETYPQANALVFTGETAQADREDPDNADLEQPFFNRGQFDNNRSPGRRDPDEL